MKKLAMLLAATSLVVGLSSVSVSAQAVDNTCTITTTGQGSVNTCTFDEDNTVTVVCTNSADITNINSQVADSGDVIVNGNTIVGNAGTGEGVNVNEFATALSLGCGPAQTVAAPTTTPVTTTPTPVAATPVKVLPKTGNDDIAKDAAIASAAVVAFVGASQVALAAYRRKALQ